MKEINIGADLADIEKFYIARINNLIAAGRQDLVQEMAADFDRVRAPHRRRRTMRRSRG